MRAHGLIKGEYLQVAPPFPSPIGWERARVREQR